MKISEAIFILERIDLSVKGNEDCPFLNLDDVNKFELAKFFLGEKDQYDSKDLKKAEKILIMKIDEYYKEQERSNSFIKGAYSPGYFEDKGKDQKKKNEGKERAKISELENLTELCITISKIGSFDHLNMGIFEANRIMILNYRRNIISKIDEFMEKIRLKDQIIHEQQERILKNISEELKYIDVANDIMERIIDEYESIGKE